MNGNLIKVWGLAQDVAHCLSHGDIQDPDQSLIGRLRHLLYNRIEWIVLVRSLEEPLPSIEPRLAVGYSMAAASGLSRLREISFPSRLSHFRTRLWHGRTCVLAMHQGRVAAYCWATDELSFEIDNLELRLRPGDAYIDDLYTAPEFRGQRIGMATHRWLLNHLQERGFKRAVTVVREHNTPALKIHEKLGFVEADHLTFRRMLLKRDYHYAKGSF